MNTTRACLLSRFGQVALRGGTVLDELQAIRRVPAQEVHAR
jgi:hypothetical protein